MRPLTGGSGIGDSLTGSECDAVTNGMRATRTCELPKRSRSLDVAEFLLLEVDAPAERDERSSPW